MTRSLLSKIALVLCLGVLYQTPSLANESTLELDNQGKYRINTANIGKIIKNFRRPDIINLAIHTLGKGVDYVLDPANNQVRFKKPVQKYDVVFCEPYLQPKCFETPEQLFAYYSQWNYGNNPGYRNPIYLNFFDKNNKNAIQLVQEGNLSEYAYIKYTVESNSLYNNIWKTLELEYQIKVMRKAGGNDNNNANQEQIVSFNELALELLLSANKGNRLAKGALDKVNKGDKSSVVVTQPKPSVPANPPKDETKPDVKPKPPTPPKQPPKKEPEKSKDCKKTNSCPPCITISGRVVRVGTIGYRHDKVPPSKPHKPFVGDHYNLYKANQNPNNGKCFWQSIGAQDASNGLPPPPNSIPIEPFR